MKIQKTLLMAAGLLIGSGCVKADTHDGDSIYMQDDYTQFIQPVSPTYLDDVTGSLGLDANWFLSVQGGMSAFVGKPVGCGDLFDRTKPLLSIGLGKWFTPHIGSRLSFQGFKFVDQSLTTRSFQSVHLDLMYNFCNGYKHNTYGLGRWGLIPYAGVGMLNNSYARKNPFAISFGLIGQYRFTKRLVFSTEIGNTMTFQDFDGIGNPRRPGDNLLQGSVGLSLILGKAGWKRVIDPMPYVYQNDWLLDYTDQLKEKNEAMSKQMVKDKAALAEMRKILRIKGLLDSFSDSVSVAKNYPRNNYSGLNSLRMRMKGQSYESVEMPAKPDTIAGPSGNECIGAPINFFFKLNTATLTSNAQQLNIAEIARVAKKHGLYIRIVGAADKATGTEVRNKELSESRAAYISEQLQKRGIPLDNIICEGIGGISRFKPDEVNRYTRVMLYSSLPD